MKSFFYLCVWISPLVGVPEPFVAEGGEAAAFAAIENFTAAEAAYRSLLSGSLPDWQQALVFYNLGTLQLMQGKGKEALALFQEVSKEKSSSLSLIRSVILNEAIGYLFQANELSTNTEWQTNLIETSLENFKKVLLLDCWLEEREEPRPSACLPLQTVSAWTRKARASLNLAHQETREHLVASFSPFVPLVALQEGIGRLLEKIHLISPYPGFFLSKGESLIPLWEHILSTHPSDAIREAYTRYLSSLKEIQKGNSALALSEAEQSLVPLSELVENIPQQELFFVKYRLLLGSYVWTKIELTNILFGLKNEKASVLFQSGLNFFEKGDLVRARFFITAAYLEAEEMEQKPQDEANEALFLLKKALRWAEQAWRLSHLLIQINPEQEKNILLEAQNHAVTTAKAFPAAVIALQKRSYQEGKKNKLACQETFWKRLFQLFDKGEEAAKKAQAWLTLPAIPLAPVLFQQQESAAQWREAVRLLESPPETSPEEQNQENAPQTEQIEEVLRKIQEMELQDDPQKPAAQGERDTW